jgi:hypothetical protein
VNEANKRGLIIAMLPTWGDKWYKDKWGTGPEIFTPANAKNFGELIAKRYLNNQIVWVLGGDRIPKNETHLAVIRAVAEGIKNADQGKHLLTYHPSGGSSSFDFFAEDKWIDFHMSQTGHRVGSPDYKVNGKALNLKTIKPHVNGEPNYEDHPNDWNPSEKYAVRRCRSYVWQSQYLADVFRRKNTDQQCKDQLAFCDESFRRFPGWLHA